MGGQSCRPTNDLGGYHKHLAHMRAATVAKCCAGDSKSSGCCCCCPARFVHGAQPGNCACVFRHSQPLHSTHPQYLATTSKLPRTHTQSTVADNNMVHLSKIKESNAQIDEETAPRIAVFVGGTSGIGKITLGAVAKLGTHFKAYVVGRKESKAAFQPFIEELHTANPNASIIWVEGQVTLLSEVKRICDYIKKLETSIDLLFLTTGYVPFFGRESKSVLTWFRSPCASSKTYMSSYI